MIVGHIGGSSSGGYEIQKSLRFRASASAYLSRTPTVAGNRKTWTWSGWVKRGTINGSANLLLFSATGTTFDNAIHFTGGGTNDLLRLQLDGNNAGVVPTAGVFRDPSAWYHIIISVDTTQATAANRVRIYVNGADVVYGSATYPTQNYDTMFNSTNAHNIGRSATSSNQYFDGYLSEINFIDGQALGPEYFGEFSAETGSWIPKKYTGTYGTNGFYLPFNDGSTLANLAADRSGNGNNWTANNFNLTPGVTYDWMDDTPTNNFAVLNAVHAGRSTLTNGNLTASGTTDLPTIIPDSGTWYFERGGVSQTWTPPAAFPSGSGDYNFGQRPFAYTPPTGFKALCTKNLPEVPASLLDPTDHHIDITVTKSGDTNFTLPWDASVYDTFFEIKRRDASGDWYQIDGLRGYDKILKSNSTAAETTDANVLGVSGTTCTLKSTLPNGVYIISATKAGLSSARQPNTDGSITSTVSRNVDSGFSIVTYTGTGVNATVGHGLGNAPAMRIVRCRNATQNCVVSALPALLGSNSVLYLNGTAAHSTADTTVWNSAYPTTSVFSVGTNGVVNGNTYQYVAYCYADSAIQKSFSYTGNGNADGPYVNLGFKCGRTLTKSTTDGTGSWLVFDSVREPSNVVDLNVRPHVSDLESSQAANYLDYTAQGVKIRGNNSGSLNIGSGTYIGHAWAATIGKYSNAR